MNARREAKSSSGAAVVEDGVADADHVAPAVHAPGAGLDVDLRREVARLVSCFARLVEGVGIDDRRRRPVVDEGDHVVADAAAASWALA